MISIASGDFRSRTRLFLPTLSWPKAVEKPLRTGGPGLLVSPSRTLVGKHPRAMWAGNRGRKIEYAKTLKALCQNPLIVCRYRHFRNSLRPRRDPKLRGSTGEAIPPASGP